MSQLAQSRLVVAGLARNCVPNIHKSLEFVETVLRAFHKDSCAVVMTNDSTDGTEAVLRKHQDKHEQFYLIFDKNLLSLYKSRTARLAYCRNYTLTYIHNNWPEHDYLLWVDLDIPFTTQDAQCFLDALNKVTVDWDMLASNPKPYYDIWALRGSQLINYDCWHQVAHDRLKGISQQEAVRNHIIKWQQKGFEVSDKLVKVDSAFGGYALYKMASTRGCVYNGRISCNVRGCMHKEICEHVDFHRDMREKHGARLFICPNMQYKQNV